MRFIALILLLAGCSQGGQPQHIIERLKPTAYHGQWLVINYWAEWCKPCIEEIPELNDLHTEAGVSVIGINYDGLQGDALEAAIKQLAISFPIIIEDPARQLAYDRPKVLPTTLVFNPEGKLAHQLVGPQTRDKLAVLTGQGRAAP